MTDKQSLGAGVKTSLALAAKGDCYCPDCSEPLIVFRDGEPIVNFEFAHIRDELPPKDPNADIGWRYWPDDMSQEQRNEFDNLILLCKPCHKLIDKRKPREFTIERLIEWKNLNEGNRGKQLSGGLTGLTLDQLETAFANAIQKPDPYTDDSMSANAKLVQASIATGVCKRKTPTEFRSSSTISGDAHLKRKNSWPPFHDASFMEIPFQISNWSDLPIRQIGLTLKWNLPTFKVSPSMPAGPQSYRVFSTFYYQNSDDWQNLEEKYEWSMVRFSSELITVSQLGPKQTLDGTLYRITNKLFLKYPTMVLKYTDINGTVWERINNGQPRKTGDSR